ncbi:MAG: hypothetical protein A3K31_17015 [Ignavibacteria bacterium RIFOXYA12_FULL_35_25]|nr:MAG: hypothetical protein A2058_13735 [Ignavibacteria bacterium GWA2_36_19]OGU62833.1 MAG: hypothetical protein A2X60_04640 [Ignavibacteria bacterium GWF2_35_20]OGU86836.1 MAG: hypothetical protein A3K31_17015 [Ignavibacteria bacterium RIFOXYA12_FULL_35_25]OGV29952.1 MAG: hypothetical protein A2523_00985 [Ignavibacteria bacterium RIFOXYD12_FULL_36_8]
MSINAVANKRRPRTGIPLKKQLPIIIKNLFNEQFYKAPLHGRTKPIITKMPKAKTASALIGWLYAI